MQLQNINPKKSLSKKIPFKEQKLSQPITQIFKKAGEEVKLLEGVEKKYFYEVSNGL
jgi:hypothetical protein